MAEHTHDDVHIIVPDGTHLGLYEAWAVVPVGHHTFTTIERLRQALSQPLWQALNSTRGCTHVDSHFEIINPWLSTDEPDVVAARYGLERQANGAFSGEVHRLAFHIKDGRDEGLQHGGIARPQTER